MNNYKRSRESGNVFLIVLMGVVLFATLAFVISRGMRSDSATAMSQRQSELAAVDLMDYAAVLERAVTKIRSKGVSESDLEFSNDVVAGYDHAEPDNAKIFNAAGGGVSWKTPPDNVNDGTAWLFTGGTCIPDVGQGDATCATDTVNNEELLLVLPNLKDSVCAELNKRAGISGVPSGGAISNSKFTGTFSEGDALSGVDGKNAGCVNIGGNNYFFYTLLAR